LDFTGTDKEEELTAEIKFVRSVARYKLYDHEQMTNMRTTKYTELKVNYCGL